MVNLKYINHNKPLLESIFSLSILNGLNLLLPLITLPYILKIVGIANYGVYAYVYVLIQYLLLINAYGFNYSATKQIAQNRDDKAKINKIYNTIIACRLLLLVIGFTFFAFLSPLILENSTKYFMFSLGLGVVVGDIFNSVWLFQGMEKMRYLTIVNVISKVVFTIFIFVFIKKADDYVYIILLNSLGFLISGFLSFIIAKKQFDINLERPKWSEMKIQFKEGFSLFGSTIGMNLYRNANIFILNFFVSEAAVGIYATAEKIIKALQMVTVPIAQALFPHLGHKFKTQSLKQNLSILFRVSKIYASILALESIFTIVAAPWIIRIFSKEELSNAVVLVRIMSIIIFIGGLNYIIGMVGLVNLGKQRAFFIAVMISGVSSIIFLLSTVYKLGTTSAALALVISEIVLFSMCLYSIWKLVKSTKLNSYSP